MISSPRVPVTTDAGATAATTTTTTTAGASQAAATPFDAILSLESLAATSATIDISNLVGADAESGLEEVTDSSTADDDTDEGDALEAGGPLAFLASLLAVPVPPTQPVGGGAPGADADAADAGGLPAQPGGQASPD